MFMTSTFIPVTTPTVMQGGSANTPFPRFPIVSIRLAGPAGNQGGSFTNPSAQALNPVPLSGMAFVGLFTTGMGGFPNFSLVLPLSPIGNASGVTATAGGFGIQVKIEGAPWRTGVAQVTTADGAKFKRTGFDHRTPNFMGTIQYVTPTRVTTNISGSESLAGFGTLQLQFVPEPSTASLVSAGIVAIGWLTRRGSRQRRAALGPANAKSNE
jgi:hypothetical protein